METTGVARTLVCMNEDQYQYGWASVAYPRRNHRLQESTLHTYHNMTSQAVQWRITTELDMFLLKSQCFDSNYIKMPLESPNRNLGVSGAITKEEKEMPPGIRRKKMWKPKEKDAVQVPRMIVHRV